MTQSNSGQRKMMRRMSPKGDPVFNAPLPSDSSKPQSSLSAKKVRRAAKKQIATQEGQLRKRSRNRAERR